MLADARVLRLVQVEVTTMVMQGPYLAEMRGRGDVAWAEVLPIGPQQWVLRQMLHPDRKDV